MENKHLLDIEELSGFEYVGSSDMFDVDMLVNTADEKKEYFLYNQNQFASDYGYNLCTLYNSITNISIFLGRRLTDDEILGLIKERIKINFNPAVGGYQTDGVDVVGKWARSLYPDKKIIWVMIENNSEVRKKIFTKYIPLMTTYRGNAEYNSDARDGFLDKLTYGKSTYGHAITDFYKGNSPFITRIDNYNNEYVIRSQDDYYTLLNNGVQGRYSWAFFSENQLNNRGKTRIKLMQMKITNGERPDDNMTRTECAITVKRINPEAKMFWNELNGDKAVTRFEFQAMFERGTGKKFPIQIYTEKTKNKTITRSEAWVLIASLLNI